MTYVSERRAAIAAATRHNQNDSLDVSQIADKTIAINDDVFAVLIDLLGQPDPHGHFVRDLTNRKFKSSEGFSTWITHASLCYHAVDIGLEEMSSSNAKIVSRWTADIVDGLHHHRDCNDAYTDEQLTDLAIVTAAAVSAHEYRVIVLKERINHEFAGVLSHFSRDCYVLKNQTIIDRVTSSHAAAKSILQVIREHKVATENQILYLLDDGVISLADGAL